MKRSEVTGRARGAGEAKGHRQRVKCPEQRDEEEEEGGEPRSPRQSLVVAVTPSDLVKSILA